VTITAEERAKWRKESRANHMYLNQDGERLLLALDALEAAELHRDTATNVVENEQARVAMYVGKYEQEVKAREKAERDLSTCRRDLALSEQGRKTLEREVAAVTGERDWLISTNVNKRVCPDGYLCGMAYVTREVEKCKRCFIKAAHHALASVDEFRAAAEVQASMAIAKRYPRDV